MSPLPSGHAPHSGRILPVRQSLLAILGICFLLMMVAVDQTVVGTALPTVVADLKGFELYAWVATSYLLTSVITIPVFGRLGDYYGRKPFVIASIIIFTLGSMACGLSSTMIQLVIARGVQGVGGGMLIGTAFACVPDLFPEPRTRLRWAVLLSSSFGIANAFGPTLGGFLTQYAGWRSVFFVNLPFGLISLYFVVRYLPHIRHIQGTRIRLDWPGALLIALVLVSLQLFVGRITRQGPDLQVLFLALACAGLLVALVKWERYFPQPVLPPEIFRHKGLVALFFLSFFTGFMMFGLLYFLPLLLQGGFGLDPQQVGMLITPMVVCITVGSLINARIVILLSRPNWILYAGFACLTSAATGFILIDVTTPRSIVFAVMMLGGIGLGFIMPNLTIFVQELAGRTLLGISTAVLQSFRMIGGMLGTTIVGALVAQYYMSQVVKAVPEGQGTDWQALLQDPQMLVSQENQSAFAAHLQRFDLHADHFIEVARSVLVTAIHVGFLTLVIVGLVALVWVYRVPLITLTRTASQPDTKETSAKEGASL